MRKNLLLIFLPILFILFIASCKTNGSSQDLSQCEKLKNNSRDFCILNSTIISHKVSDCVLINNPQIKDLCYLKISAKKNNTELCSDVKISKNIELCYFGIAAQTKNPAICDNIPQKGVSEYKKEICIKIAQLKEESPEYEEEGDKYSSEALKTAYYRTTKAQDEMISEGLEINR